MFIQKSSYMFHSQIDQQRAMVQYLIEGKM